MFKFDFLKPDYFKIRKLKKMVHVQHIYEDEIAITGKRVFVGFGKDRNKRVNEESIQIFKNANIPELMGVDPMYAWKTGIVNLQYRDKIGYDSEDFPTYSTVTTFVHISYESLLYYFEEIKGTEYEALAS